MAPALKASVRELAALTQSDEPSVRGRSAAKVNVIGVLVSKTPGVFIVDDGTGSIAVRSFGSEVKPLDSFEVGEIINVIGRLGFFGAEPYISPEIAARSSQKMLALRQLELERDLLLSGPSGAESVIIEEVAGAPAADLSDAAVIRELIREMDIGNDGKGADIEEISRKSNMGNAEALIRSLIELGEVFEVRPGRLKVLE
ncbi:OB-fold nucleic acid binding domain-containing protein [Candidatus Woesearchaeota archaeon]|nr:OB-fold nucleic acid binding domain-containing protein [Candidatus Woesearchaeota archaeon]